MIGSCWPPCQRGYSKENSLIGEVGNNSNRTCTLFLSCKQKITARLMITKGAKPGKWFSRFNTGG